MLPRIVLIAALAFALVTTAVPGAAADDDGPIAAAAFTCIDIDHGRMPPVAIYECEYLVYPSP